MMYIKQYLVTLIVFFVVDILWLTVIAKKLYAKYLGYIMTDNVNLVAAGIFYGIFIVGILYFVINPALSKDSLRVAIVSGALFGFITYATYDLTNLATLKDWPIMITVIDITWGTLLSTIVSTVSYLILK